MYYITSFLKMQDVFIVKFSIPILFF